METVFVTCCIMKQICLVEYISRKKYKKASLVVAVVSLDHGGLQLEHSSELAKVFFPQRGYLLSLSAWPNAAFLCLMCALSNLNLIFAVQQVLQISNNVLALSEPDLSCPALETVRLGFLSREKTNFASVECQTRQNVLHSAFCPIRD